MRTKSVTGLAAVGLLGLIAGLSHAAPPPVPADSGAVPPATSPPSADSPTAPAERPRPPAASKSPPKGQPFGKVAPAASEAEAMAESLDQQRERLLSHMQRELVLTAEQLGRVRQLMFASSVMGQGNPKISLHPVGRAECRAAVAARPLQPGDARCGAPHMVTVDSPPGAGEPERVCIDQFEFPNIPCEYPVVHVTAREAALLCEAVGKRLCDAHEWEGACAGSLQSLEREYAWGRDRQSMRRLHNGARQRVWAYGPEKNHETCATTSFKTPGCPGGGYNSCGSNTFPAGAFPDCVSPVGVYDQHGNAAEHMSLPLRPEELTRRGGSGATEMKGSWFIFSHYEAHEDDCRWRAPDWHPSRVMASHSHGNYHLGFRCCKSIPAEPAVARPQ